jgi:hypothetical protein
VCCFLSAFLTSFPSQTKKSLLCPQDSALFIWHLW